MGKSTAILFAALSGLAGLEGCATGGMTVTTPTAPLPWTAAIGRLDNERDAFSCTATLVAPDTIVTAAHCLFLRGREVDAGNLAFTPFAGGGQRLKPSQGVQILAFGGKVDGDQPSSGATEEDWGLVRISPAVNSWIKPIGIASFGADEIASKIAAGAALSNAGYGVYGIMNGKRLHQHDGCGLVRDTLPNTELGANVIVVDCPVIKGDSGGPILLTEKDGTRRLVGVISGYMRSKDGAVEVSFGANAANFAARLSMLDAAAPAAQP